VNNEKKAPVRQIKYRAYCIVEEKMFSVTQIDWKNELITVNEGDNTITDTFDMFILMQFTGKLTKAGTEIYDGDKLQQTKDCYWVVKWSDSNCGWSCYQYVFSQDEDGEYSWKKSDTYPLGHSLIGLLTYNYEVIGNIHEESEVSNG